MATQVNLGIGVVDNTQSGLSSAERNISRFSKKSIKQLELEAKVSFPSIAGQIDGLEKNFSALKRKLGKFQFSGMRVGKKGNILGDMLFDAREIRGNLSTDVTKGLLDNLKAIQKGLSTGSVKSNNILGIDTAKEIKKINELIAALETYNKQMKVIERAWGAQDTAKIQAEKRKAYSAEFEEARKQKKDDELFRRRWAHEFGQWNKKDAELARLQREADQRAKDARIQYDRKINSGTDTRTPELNDLRKFYQEQEKLANKAANAEAEANKEVERQFKSRVKAKRNAADIEVAIDNERAARDKASKTHSDRTVENIKKEIASLKELRKAENALDRAQGKKSRNARHDSDTNQRIKLLEQEAEEAKKSADERKKADKDATDAARRNAKSRREWIKKEQALMKKLGGVILRAFSIHQIIRFGEQIAKTTGYYEQQQIALEGILKSATKARSVLNDITNFALKSPFTTKELVGFTKKLSAFGIGSDDLFPTVTKLADISAGLGVDMSRIILAYGQVKSASVLRGQELRQFTEAGIPMVEALAKKFTELNGELVTTSDIFELISERKVSFEMVSDVLSDMTAEGGSFYKMQEELTNTLAGQMSKLSDMWDLALRDMGKSGS
jgi:tape measure domain-containing protein